MRAFLPGQVDYAGANGLSASICQVLAWVARPEERRAWRPNKPRPSFLRACHLPCLARRGTALGIVLAMSVAALVGCGSRITTESISHKAKQPERLSEYGLFLGERVVAGAG